MSATRVPPPQKPKAAASRTADRLMPLKEVLFAKMAAVGIKRLRMNYVISPTDIYLTDIWDVDEDNRELNWLNPPAARSPGVVALIDAVDNLCYEVFSSGRHAFATGTGSGRMIADGARQTVIIHDTVAVTSELHNNTYL